MNTARWLWSGVLWIITGEFLLRWFPNCGPLIVARTLFASTLLFLAALGVTNAINPSRSWCPSWYQARLDVLAHASWFGALCAGMYVALYTRFASQWQYLAGLYNQIKQAETTNKADADALAQWKAGFIEDAQELHLARKPLFAVTIKHWCSDPKVCAALKDNGRNTDVDALLRSLDEALSWKHRQPPAPSPCSAGPEAAPAHDSAPP
jgi:hypothetical protein